MRDGTNKLLYLAAGLGACYLLRQVVRSARTIDLKERTALITGGSRGLGLVLARELAGHGGIGKQHALGKESESWAAPSVLTTLTERAARRNNEMAEEGAG
jgi:hypothetical protein